MAEKRVDDRRLRARALRAEGVPVGEIADEFGVDQATVYRWLQAARDESVGPVERAVGAVVDQQGELDVVQSARAELLRSLAMIVDRARQSGSGVGWSAGTQAVERLWEMMSEFAPDDETSRFVRGLFEDSGFVPDGWGAAG